MAGKSTGRPADGLAPPLTRLYEQAGLPACGLPRSLAAVYGGDLGFGEPCVYANFVASVDGVTALGSEYPSSGSAISGRDPADRFVMGLLRACADVVLIGAGTLRATSGHLMDTRARLPGGRGRLRRLAPQPGARRRSAACRRHRPRRRARRASPERAGALILTTAAGARRLRGWLPPSCTILDLGDRPTLPPGDLLAAVRARGASTVLTEGGPRLLGQLVADGLLDELFLTVFPVLAGRADTSRPGLVAARELLPGRTELAELLSVRQRGSYLFLRYRLGRKEPAGSGYDHGHGSQVRAAMP